MLSFYVCMLSPRSAVLLTPVICGHCDSLSLPQGPVPPSHPLTETQLSVQVSPAGGENWCDDHPHRSTTAQRPAALKCSYLCGLRCTWLPLGLTILQLTDYGNASLSRFCLTGHIVGPAYIQALNNEWFLAIDMRYPTVPHVSLCAQMRGK